MKWPKTILKKIISTNLFIYLLLATLILGIYSNSLMNEFVSDDIGIINNRHNFFTYDFLFRPGSYFLRNLYLAVVSQVCGLSVTCWHLLNVFLHLLNSILVFLIISKLTSRTVALIATLIFASHPIQVEAVSWVSGGGYLQYSFFFLLSFYFYLNSTATNFLNPRTNYLLSVLFFLFALLSLSWSISLFLIFVVYEWALGNIKKNFRKLLPYISLCFLFGVAAIFNISQRIQETQAIGQTEGSFHNPVYFVPLKMLTYFKLLFWPQDLTFAHVFNYDQAQLFLRDLVLGTLLTMIVATALVISWKRERKIFFGLALFLISLTVNFLPLNISTPVAERYLYLGSVGFFVASAMLLTTLAKHTGWDKLVSLMCVVLVFALMGRTIIRNNDWKTEITLLESALKVNSYIPKASFELAINYLQEGRLDEASDQFKAYLRSQPDSSVANQHLGDIYQQGGNQSQAIHYYQKALELNPNSLLILQSLAEIYYEKKEWGQVMTYLKKQSALSPQNPTIYLNLGKAYQQLNQKEEARKALQKSLELNPNNQSAKTYLQELGD